MTSKGWCVCSWGSEHLICIWNWLLPSLFLAAYGNESLLICILQWDQCLKLWWNRHLNSVEMASWKTTKTVFLLLLLCFSNSDDNLLKNIELFDKLSLRFNGRVLFIKDVIGDEICCWSFYGQGRKLAEVCCTSIVYATEKKQTKVMEFYPPVSYGLKKIGLMTHCRKIQILYNLSHIAGASSITSWKSVDASFLGYWLELMISDMKMRRVTRCLGSCRMSWCLGKRCCTPDRVQRRLNIVAGLKKERLRMVILKACAFSPSLLKLMDFVSLKHVSAFTFFSN